MSTAEKPKNYDPKIQEETIKKYWSEHNIYKFDEHTKKPIFSIDTPPPTISGKMHIGHAFSFAQQDILARYKRMKGYEVFYPFGTDDNGLPTEKLVQKQKNVLSSHMERDAFIKICLDFLKEERPHFIQDWINIGMSCDFSKTYSTIDSNSRKIAQKTFLELAKKKLVYRKEAPVIWDTMFQTSIAQAELEDVEKTTLFNDIIFKTEDGKDLIIATTRPELLAACAAVFVHPDDKRYKKLIGKHAISPLYNVKIPILADEKADPEKGTGVVMCCTFGDQTDIEWYKKHKLPLKMAITRDGKMSELSGKYAGKKIAEARKEIIEDLKAAGLLKSQKEITHTVNVGERSGVPIEIMNSQQWYVEYLDKKDFFLECSEKLVWHPQHMKHRLDNWIRGLNWDWSISRQRKYGVPIPVWYDAKGNVYYADESQLPVDPVKDKPLSAPKGVELIPETDVFDTWFTSASSPFLATHQFEGKPIYKKLFPMDLRPQAHDIINFWLFYTMAKTQLLHNVNPWKNVAISGFVLDPKGDKMSKSKGNAVSPQEVIKKYSADAIRYWAATSKLGEDLPYQEKDLVTCNKLVTKLWNAAKFVEMFTKDADCKRPAKLIPNDQWLLLELSETIKKVTESFEEYEYAKARQEAELFFWGVFCDSYLESIKKILYEPQLFEAGAKESTLYTLKTAFNDILRVFAPIIPFVTETIYLQFFKEKEDSIHNTDYPTGNYGTLDKKNIESGKIAHNIMSAIRRFKSDKSVPLNTPVKSIVIECDKSQEKELTPFTKIIECTAVATAPITFAKVKSESFSTDKAKVELVLGEVSTKK